MAKHASTKHRYDEDEIKKVNVFAWCFFLIQLIFVVWLITGIVAVSHDVNHCQLYAPNSASLCREAKETGATLGVALIVFAWVAVDVILGISRWVYKRGHS